MQWFDAAIKGDIAEMQSCRDTNPTIDPNILDTSSTTALIYAAKSGWADFIFALHEAFGDQIDPNIHNKAKECALSQAVMNDHLSCIIALHKCFPNLDISQAFVWEDFPYSKHNVFHWTAREGRDECLKVLYQCFPQYCEQEAYQALALAAQYGHQTCIETIVKCFPTIFDQPGGFVACQDALLLSSGHGHVECIRTLCALFPALYINYQNNYGNTALIRAVEGGSIPSILTLGHLFPLIDPNIANCEGDTALFHTIRHDNTINTACARTLLENFPQIDINATNRLNSTFLQELVVTDSNIELIRLIYQQFPNIDVNFRSKNGSTALLIAANCGSKDTILALHRCFNNIDPYVHDQYHYTVLSSIIKAGHVDCIPVLARCFPDIDPNAPNIYDYKTPLMIAITLSGFGQHNIIQLLTKHFPRTDPNYWTNSTGNTALMYVIDETTLSTLYDIFSTQIDVNIQNFRGKTVLMKTRSAKRVEMLRQLFPSIDPSLRNNDGRTALMCAVGRIDIEHNSYGYFVDSDDEEYSRSNNSDDDEDIDDENDDLYGINLLEDEYDNINEENEGIVYISDQPEGGEGIVTDEDFANAVDFYLDNDTTQDNSYEIDQYGLNDYDIDDENPHEFQIRRCRQQQQPQGDTGFEQNNDIMNNNDDEYDFGFQNDGFDYNFGNGFDDDDESDQDNHISPNACHLEVIEQLLIQLLEWEPI